MDAKIRWWKRQHFSIRRTKILNDNWTKIGSCEPTLGIRHQS